MNLKDNLRLLILLRLPWHKKIRERYYLAMRESEALLRAELDMTHSDHKASQGVYGEYMRTIRTIGKLLLNQTYLEHLGRYKKALAHGNMDQVKEIEASLG